MRTQPWKPKEGRERGGGNEGQGIRKIGVASETRPEIVDSTRET